MLDSQAVRVGFVTQLLWPRYGGFWRQLVEASGAETVFPTLEGVRGALADQHVQGIATASFRLAAAQAVSLAEQVDWLVVPMLNSESASARGGAQDPFIADFPSALANAVPGLPVIKPVPAALALGLEPGAVELIRGLVRDAAQVARVWGRVRAQAKPARLPAVNWDYRPGELATVALIGQPWLHNDELTRSVTRTGEHLVPQHRLDAAALREEGLRLDPQLIDTDAETLGAARMAARRASVDRIRLVVDAASGADAWLVRRVEKVAHKAVEVVSVQDALAGRDAVDTLSNLQLD